MRHRKPFSLYRVPTDKGRPVYYFRAYDENGKRTSGRSTYQSSRAAAEQYVTSLIQKGQLVSTARDISFEKYAQGWFTEQCRYSRIRQLSEDHRTIQGIYLRLHILPHLGKTKLHDITPRRIEEWRSMLLESGLSRSTVRNVYSTFRLMLREAVRLEYLENDPTRKVSGFPVDSQYRELLSKEEESKVLAVESWRDYPCYLANLTAAWAGIRLGEVLALRAEDLQDDGVLIVHRSLTRRYAQKDTKTRDTREIPLPFSLTLSLRSLKAESEGFLFSKDGGRTPLKREFVRNQLYQTLRRVGIPEEERKRRGLNFHCWRHHANTRLRALGVPDSVVMRITGHRTDSMRERYTHLTNEQVREALNSLISEQVPELKGMKN